MGINSTTGEGRHLETYPPSVFLLWDRCQLTGREQKLYPWQQESAFLYSFLVG